MSSADKARVHIASAFVVAAAIWPSTLCAITAALATPLQRAMQSAWCGASPQAFEILGHCPACWSGSAAFALAAAYIISAPNRRAARAAS